MEYTNEDGAAEIASTKRLVSTGDIPFEIAEGHTSMAYVTYGSGEHSDAFNPTVIPA